MEDLASIGIAPNSYMPELPEVETVKNVLLPVVKGRKILSIDILRVSTIHGDIDEFKDALSGQTFLDLSRIGKFLIFHLTNDLVIISHLRMEGKYYEVLESEENTKYSRVVFHLDNGHKLCYDDSRCFGMMKLSNEKEYKDVKDIAQLGPEPFDIKDVHYLMERTKRSTLPIKSTLLDQTLMTGLGNIYADEVLFASKIHPLTPANKITEKEWKLIVKNAQDILNEAIKEGGSTIKSYHPGKDIDGNFQSVLKAYGKKGEKCVNCTSIMRFMKVNGRGTTYCPKCQIQKAEKLKIAVYGRIASGKSTVLECFKEKGFYTIDSDDIVAELYQKESVAKMIGQAFDLPFDQVVDKNILRDYINQNPKSRKKLEKLVHPLVKKEILRIFKTVNSRMIVVEVPLLFESKMDNLFDVIIAVDVPSKKQKELLYARNPLTAEALLKINSEHKFDENKRKADFVLTNAASPIILKDNTYKIINELLYRLG